MTSPILEAGGRLPRSAVAGRGMDRLRLASFPSPLERNPYQRLLYEQLARNGVTVEPRADLRFAWLWEKRREIDLLHFHWPHGYWHPRAKRRLRGRFARRAYVALFALRLRFARLLGYRIAWTIHQVYPHEAARNENDRRGAAVLARASDVLFAHDGATADAARAELGLAAARRIEIVRHGSYVGAYPRGRARDDVRLELGLAPHQILFLHLGDLRGYKDVGTLLGAFCIAALPDAALLIAGAPADDETEDAVRSTAASDPRVLARLEFIPDEGIKELFDAADIAVLSRSDGGTSGSLILAMSMGKAVVAADRPVYRELVGPETAGWLFEPGSRASLRAALERAAGAPPAERSRKAEAALARARSLDWSEIGSRTAALLRAGSHGGRQ